MSESLPDMSPQLSSARITERLRQERETFDQHKSHQNRWFILRLVMGYSSVALLTAILVVSSYILLNSASFSSSVVASAGAALFVDTLGLVVSIWKVVFNPKFMTALSPTTQLTEPELRYFDVPQPRSDSIIIYSAKYGADQSWMDVAPLLRSKLQDGQIRTVITNEVLGGDPARGVRKLLEITYSYEGNTYSTTVSEGDVLLMPEPAPTSDKDVSSFSGGCASCGQEVTPNNSGPERRQRFSHQTWCGEG